MFFSRCTLKKRSVSEERQFIAYSDSEFFLMKIFDFNRKPLTIFIVPLPKCFINYLSRFMNHTFIAPIEQVIKQVLLIPKN